MILLESRFRLNRGRLKKNLNAPRQFICLKLNKGAMDLGASSCQIGPKRKKKVYPFSIPGVTKLTTLIFFGGINWDNLLVLLQ